MYYVCAPLAIILCFRLPFAMVAVCGAWCCPLICCLGTTGFYLVCSGVFAWFYDTIGTEDFGLYF